MMGKKPPWKQPQRQAVMAGLHIGTCKFLCLFQEASTLNATEKPSPFDHYLNREEQYMAKPPSPYNLSGTLGI